MLNFTPSRRLKTKHETKTLEQKVVSASFTNTDQGDHVNVLSTKDFTNVYCMYNVYCMLWRGHCDTLVTHSSPTSEVGGSNPGH